MLTEPHCRGGKLPFSAGKAWSLAAALPLRRVAVPLFRVSPLFMQGVGSAHDVRDRKCRGWRLILSQRAIRMVCHRKFAFLPADVGGSTTPFGSTEDLMESISHRKLWFSTAWCVVLSGVLAIDITSQFGCHGLEGIQVQLG